MKIEIIKPGIDIPETKDPAKEVGRFRGVVYEVRPLSWFIKSFFIFVLIINGFALYFKFVEWAIGYLR